MTRATGPVDPPGVKGTLRLSRYGVDSRSKEPQRHVSRYVSGTYYGGMEDNDLRGFTDGSYQWGWNQPGQVHVRLGRTGEKQVRSPRYGEQEIFRVIQRWDQILLPAQSRVLSAQLVLTLEEGPARETRIMLYEVKKDWNPGTGGVHENNVSVPKQGEVWWNDVAFGEIAWGLPGVGFASGEHPDADTDAMPLADAVCRPGDSSVAFSSPRLARYISERIAQGKPLLILLKLSDYQEDIPGTLISFYSGNHGDSRNAARRPRLVLEWESAAEQDGFAEDVFLEYGRSMTLPAIPAPGSDWIAISFDSEPGYAQPLIDARGLDGCALSPWTRASHPFSWSGESIQVRVSAVTDPVVLGQSFVADVKDTWVVTAPPEKQVVGWTFVSPTGLRHVVNAEYRGRFRWTVSFAPDEIGPWQYYWTQNFAERPYRSSVGLFDVVVGGRSSSRSQLWTFAERLEIEGRSSNRDELRRQWVLFSRLQRAAIQLEDPASFAATQGRDLRNLINRVRSLLWGKPIPDPIPLESHPLTSEALEGSAREPIPRVRTPGPGQNRRGKRRHWLVRRVNGLRTVKSISARIKEAISL